MRVVVVGGGVIGVTTSYYLAIDGHQVTVIERDADVATGTSFANAGLVSAGDSWAWASPEALRNFLKSLIRSQPGIRVRPGLDPRLWGWSVRFLRECTSDRARLNSLRKLRLTLYSRDCLDELVAQTGVRYDARRRGIVYFHRDQHSLDHGITTMRVLADHGLSIEVVDRQRMVELEPALARAAERIVGGVYAPRDQTGDCCLFTRNLADWCAVEHGVEYRCGTRVVGFDRNGSRVTAVMTGDGPVEADCVVLAAGCDSPALAAPLGIRLPIYPVKGYSVTVPVKPAAVAPSMGGVDEDRRMAFSRLGNRIRLTACAEFVGHDTGHRPDDFRYLLATARELFPDGADFDAAEYWAGLRPMTPSSVPIHGRARFDNFYLNTGHGHVGWTMACGSGRLVADLVAGHQPSIDTEGLLYP